mmetsp:Transcript_7530/g.11598  ORF Transcript_7530/g.11598 Transcript_7530/m.11598 type:complete len:106 (-) Transcript_7530:60-377(-)
MHAMMYCFRVVYEVKPDLLLVNGPGTCIPIVAATLVFKCLGFCRGDIVFVESFCRVKSLSLTGILLYPVVDRFFVCWKELKQKYPFCDVITTFIDDENDDANNDD